MNSRLETAIQMILDVTKNKDLPHDIRIKLLNATTNIMNGQSEYEEQLRELRELLYRNPAFPDDLVGWLDDDFDLPDDEEDDKNH